MKIKILHENEFWKFGLDKEKNIMYYVWKEKSRSITDERFMLEMMINAQKCEEYNPRLSLINTRKFLFPISPEMQEWVDNEIFPRFVKAGVQKLAFISSEDILAGISVEQMMDEDMAIDNFEVKHFREEGEALDWLCEDDG